MDINIGTGLKEYNLNGAVKVYFNPTDAGFVRKLYGTFTALDKKQDEYRREIEQAQGTAKIFEIADARDKEMREMIDGIFEIPVCQPLFGSMNVYAMADGLPVWANLLLAIMDEIDDSFAMEQKKMTPRIDKYTAKYQKK